MDKLKFIINKIIEKNNEMTGRYMMPYSEANDDYADWKVSLKFKRVNIWKTEKYNRCKYSGSLYLDTNVIIGFEGDWEKSTLWDLPSWVIDDIRDKVLDDIEKFLPMVCVDLTFN